MTSTQTDDFELLRAGNFEEILQAYEELDRDGLFANARQSDAPPGDA